MALSASNIITFVGFTLILFYVVSKIMNFYGYGTEVYGAYMGFYLFLLLSVLVLPRENP
jgi:predicted cobalt transporter CbtA